MTPSPVGALGTLAELAPEGFPHLIAARERTEVELAGLRAAFKPLAIDPDVAVVLFGSWGRRELTEHSDADWALVVDGRLRDMIRPTPDRVADVVQKDRDGPGSQAIFGGAVACDNLVERIGLDRDDNTNLTRRSLLMLESVAVAGEAAHARCRGRVLDAYLQGEDADHHPPRFLLNDVIRYWRTICVDFAGKARVDDGKWAMRILKLRTNRKVLFAGALLPVLACHRCRADEMPGYLAGQLQAPATDRIAQAFMDHDAVDAGIRALGAYDRWIGMLGNPDIRYELAGLTQESARRSANFRRGKRLATELEQGLLALLFETSLVRYVREYAIF